MNYDIWKGRILRALWRYGLAVFSVMAALAITIPLKQYTDITPLFYAAIVLSAWFGGMGPGLIAVLLSAVAIDYYFVEPLYTLGLETKRISFLLVFGLLAILTSWMSTNRKRAQQALQQARNELELRVQERTAELRQANETLRERANLLDLTHDTVFVRDMNDVITFWNKGAEEQYGWTSEDAVGQVSHDITKTRFAAPLEDIRNELTRTGRWEGELVHTRRDGTVVTVASRWALQRDERGNPIAILETNNDITERKRAEEALQRVQTELAHVTRVMTLGELTASIAHEVNQPLAAIVTNGNACLRWLAAAQPNLAEGRQAVERIIKDSYRASDVISRIRTLVKKAPPRKDLINLNEVILEVFALAQNEVRRHRVYLRRDLSRELPLVQADRVQLQQVILNLIMNGLEAIDKSKNGPRELSVSSSNHQPDSVLVSVRDSGEGLDEANLDRVFDAFFTTKPDGMGMGLAISRTIIESHGGRLWATANTPRGAAFQFTLPTSGERAS
ncbi:MAG TPA: ATP-binding protein [Pyrinomonadaceae bacterium]|nr:ATP-binding protein [Pyrinomonadaceae bacterium]